MQCRMSGYQGGSVMVVLPLSCQGEFYKCFSLRDIVSSAQLCSGRFCCVEAADGAERPLVLCPVYDVEARMHLRKDTVRFLSSVEMDVVEVTHQNTSVITPFSLDELLPLPDHTFPAMAQILEIQKVEHLVCSGWVDELRRHQQLVLHSKGSVTMFLLSSIRKSKRQYFLMSEGYGGRFRRRPREFLSVFEVYVAANLEPGLRVTVTQLSQEAEDYVPSLTVGEELEVVGFHTGGQDTLICRRIEELSEDEDEEGVSALSPSSTTLVLPLHWPGFFREVIANNKKYKIKDLCQQFSLPLDVKVASQDNDLASDPLYKISSLRLEGVTVETVIQACFPTCPELCFTIPTRCLSMDIYFTQNSLPWPKGEPPVFYVDTVTEVTESFYLQNCRLIYSQQVPPPRPPKTNLLSAGKGTPKQSKPEPLVDCLALSANSRIPEEGLSKLSMACKAKPSPKLPQVPGRKQALPSPTTSHKSSAPLQSIKPQVSAGEVQSEDSDNDYEDPDDTLNTIKKMREYVLY